VCESHYLAGGAAHSFERDGYTFDSGPSFYSGISSFPSVNPLGQVCLLAPRLPSTTAPAIDTRV
jgi:phytoene dehydrogenase-like protein